VQNINSSRDLFLKKEVCESNSRDSRISKWGTRCRERWGVGGALGKGCAPSPEKKSILDLK